MTGSRLGPPPAGTLADVLPGTLAALGVPGIADPLDLAASTGPLRQAVVLLVDGLGLHLLAAAAQVAPAFADVLAGRTGVLRELSCAFPTTTPTSLVTLGTGALPGAHGVLGFTVNLPGTDRVLTHVAWRDEPPPGEWQPVPRLLERAGLTTAVVGPGEFVNSGLTAAAYGAARYVAARPGRDTAHAVVGELRAGTRLVYAYHAALDMTAHLHGVASRRWEAAARRVGRLITQIAERLPPDTALLVTADHGCLDVGPHDRYDISDDPRLAAGLRLATGEPRVRYLHTLPGAQADVIDTWLDVLAGRATVHPRAELIDAGWFGPVTREHAERIGDIVVICHDPIAIFGGVDEPPVVTELIGFHGSVSAAETAIPLITITG